MQIFFWLLLPLLELYVLIKVGSEVGALTVVALIILSAIAGIFCIRMAGLATALSVRERMARGEVPDDAMLTGLLWVIGGVLLFIPGFISDAVGLLCILPMTRNWLLGRMRKGRPQPDIHAGYHRTYTRESSEGRETHVIEGEFERKDKE